MGKTQVQRGATVVDGWWRWARQAARRGCTAAALLALAGMGQAQVIYTYEDVPGTPITTGNNNCPNGGITRTFTVNESFNVGAAGTVALGIIVLHSNRDHVQIRLTAPNNNTVVLADGSGSDANDNYNVTFGDPHDTTALLNDGDNDPASVASGTVFYRRLVNVANLSSTLFPSAGSVNGTWTLRICDDTAGTAGTYVRARLTLRDNTTTTVPSVCASNVSFDWGTVTTVPASAIGATLPDGTTITTGGVTMTQVQTVGAPSDFVPSFRRLDTTNGADPGYYGLIMDLSNVSGVDDAELAVESARFSFSPPVSGLDFQMLDVDYSSTNWEDYVQVIGFNAAGERVPYLQTFLVGSPTLSRVGDWVEADGSNVDNASNAGNVRYRFLDTVSSITVGYAAGDEPQNDPVQQVVGIGDPNFCAFDYGDGPASYGTLLANNGPRHGLINRSRLFMGSTPPDGEADALVSAGATGDNTSLNNDEAGSVTFPPPRLANQGWVCGTYTTNPNTNEYCVTVSVTNTTGTAAQLVGWIDFNNNGSFGTGERSLPDLRSVATTGFNTGNIPNGSSNFQAVLVFSPSAPIPNNSSPSMIRLRLSTDPSFFSDASPPSHLGAASDGEVEDHAIPINTLPVTLAGFNAVRLNAQELAVRWSVATEAGSIGYRILQGSTDGTLHPLNPELIVATGVDSLLPQLYSATLNSSSNSPLYLEELSSHGRTERFGPYEIGAVSGDTLAYQAAHWNLATDERLLALARQNDERGTQLRQRGIAEAEVLVSETGMQRFSVAQLRAAGVDLEGRDSSLLRLRNGNEFVALRVVPEGALGLSSVIEFYGLALTGSQYTRTNPYRLSADGGAGPIPGWSIEPAAPQSGPAADRVRREVALDTDLHYSFSAPGPDPWYFDTVQRNGAATGKSWTLQIDGLREGPAGLTLEVWGGLDYEGALPDHRYQVALNGSVLGERSFDGVNADTATWALPDGLLRDGANEVRVELLETGHPVDILRVESIRISAVTRLTASDTATGLSAGMLVPLSDGLFSGGFEPGESPARCGLPCDQLRVAGLPDADVLALRVRDGQISQLQGVVVISGTQGYEALVKPQHLVQPFDPLGGSEKLLVLSRSQFRQPGLRPAAVMDHPLSGGQAQLVLIAPHRYLGDLAPLLAARRAEGLSARAVDVEHIYAHYSAGVVDPLAIRSFLEQARNQLGTRYVLLVGGDTYDYFDRLQLGSVSDIPTLYGRTHPVVNHAPLDQALVDFDADGRPELAIGRLPVRTSAELQQVLQRIVDGGQAAGRALLIAERSNPAEGADYAAEVEQLITTLPNPWQSQAQRIYLDQYPAGATGIAQARTAMVDSISAGRSLVSYFGHGSPTVWSREQLLQSAQLPNLFGPGTGSAPVVTEFGCWGGYFVAPQYNTMSHGWLGAGAGAASAVFASSGLTEHHSDRRMAETLLPALTQPGVRLGDALLQAKQQLHAVEPELQDVLRGMSLFGDPSMRMPTISE